MDNPENSEVKGLDQATVDKIRLIHLLRQNNELRHQLINKHCRRINAIERVVYYPQIKQYHLKEINRLYDLIHQTEEEIKSLQ